MLSVYTAKIIEAIHSIRFDRRHDFFEIPTPSIPVTVINGGTKVKNIPKRCELALDRRMISGEKGIPTVIFGPGNEKLSHQVDECVRIEDLVTATQVYGAAFEKLL